MRLGVDLRYGLVVVADDQIFRPAAATGAPDGHPDPLLWVIQNGVLPAAGEPLGALVPTRLAAPIARPPKVVAAPVNYVDHQLEMHEQKTIAEYGVFLKAPTSVIGPSGTIVLPYTDTRTDQEGELGVVIGTGGRDISSANALDHIFGYTCVLDISVRSTEDRSTRKSFDTFTPLGPWVTTRDEVPDPGALGLRCWVNDELRQSTTTRDLIYDVPLLVEYASSVMTLEPGDVIATGTPSGVGALADGDVVRVSVERLGELSVPVTAAGAVPYADRPRARDRQ